MIYHRSIEDRRQEMSKMKNRLSDMMREEKIKVRRLISNNRNKMPRPLDTISTDRYKRINVNIKNIPLTDRKVYDDNCFSHQSQCKSYDTNRKILEIQEKNAKCKLQKEFNMKIKEAATYNMLMGKQKKKQEVLSDIVYDKQRKKDIAIRDKMKIMKGVMKVKISEYGIEQAEKSLLLTRKRETNKRLERDNRINLKKLKQAKKLMNYSLDIENMIKSNIEATSKLESHYESHSNSRSNTSNIVYRYQSNDDNTEKYNAYNHTEDGNIGTIEHDDIRYNIVDKEVDGNIHIYNI